MEIDGWRTKPDWATYEASLLERGYVPCWDPTIAARLETAAIMCCCCGTRPSYVGMTNGAVTLGFLACGPDCGEWIWFLAPAPSTRP